MKHLLILAAFALLLITPYNTPAQKAKPPATRNGVVKLTPSIKYLIRDALAKMRGALDLYDQSKDRARTGAAVVEASKAAREVMHRLPEKHPIPSALHDVATTLFDALSVWGIESGLGSDKEANAKELERIKRLYKLETDVLSALRGVLMDIAREKHKEAVLRALDHGV